jgi:hypothetical protein
MRTWLPALSAFSSRAISLKRAQRLALAVSAALLAVMAQSASAQVQVEMTLEQDQFLQGESVPVAVRVTNRSGQTLHLGRDADWLTFSVESRDGFVVAKLGDAPVQGEFTLESSKVAIKRVDLEPWFGLSQPGRYEIVATVKIKEWSEERTSPARAFNVIHGAFLWEREFGVPQPAGAASGPPEVRKYVLQQANYLKGQIRLYLSLTDASGAKVFRVFPVGPMVSFSHPEAQVDKSSNLHLLYANGMRSYSYTVFNPDGNVLARQTYDYLSTRPRLQLDEDGNITVAGGSHRITANDVPSPKPTAPDAQGQTPKP